MQRPRKTFALRVHYKVFLQFMQEIS